MSLTTTNISNNPLDTYRKREGYIRIGMPKESCCAKIKDVASDAISNVASWFSKSSAVKSITNYVKPIATVIKPLSKIGTFLALNALVSSVISTPVAAVAYPVAKLAANILNKSSPVPIPLIESIKNNFSFSSFLENTKSGIIGGLIYLIAFPILRNVLHDEEIHVPIPKDHATAAKVGSMIGKTSGLSNIPWIIGRAVIENFIPEGIYRYVAKGLALYGWSRTILYFL